MDEMNIENAKYATQKNDSINCTIDGAFICVPVTHGNRHYDEIMRQVEAGTLTIADAD